MKKRQRTRNRSRIDELPEEIRSIVDERLANVNITYNEIAEEICKKGYEISRSSIGRYAIRQGAVLNRMMEAQAQTKVLVNAVKNSPETDYTDAGLFILMDLLIKKMAIAQEEIDEMEPDKAGRLMVAISRTAAYKEKIKAELNKHYRKAINEVKLELKAELQTEPELLAKMIELTERVEDKVMKKIEGENE
jgi:hypothetical protein